MTRRERKRFSSSRTGGSVHRSVPVELSSGADGTRRRRHRSRLGRRGVAPKLVVTSATATDDSTVGQLLCLQQLLVLGDAQSLAVDHTRPLWSRSGTHNIATRSYENCIFRPFMVPNVRNIRQSADMLLTSVSLAFCAIN